jgi:predicted nuclease of predicted toxin-antitoxin system
MRLFVDECVYAITTQALRSWGHDVVTAQEAGLDNHPDEELLAFAVPERRILISIDMDFSNVRHYVPADHQGIMILKVRPSVIQQVHDVLKQFLENHKEEEIHQTLVIIDRNKVRIRR